MKNRFPRMTDLSRTPLALALVATVGIADVPLPAGPSAAAYAGSMVVEETEDVVYLADGRVLRGNILEEDRITMRFEVVDRKLNLSTALTLLKSDILRIQRDVPVAVEAKPEVVEDTSSPSKSRATNYDPNLPGVYVIPIKGQIGTDVLHEVYDPIIADVKVHKPEVVVFALDCNSVENNDHMDFEELRELVHKLKNSLKDTRQVVWIEDASGLSSVVALSWNEIYMRPGARLDGLHFVGQQVGGWQDEHVREKMRAAWSGIVMGFMELGKHDLNLGKAMMFPEEKLSATFKGLNVVWTLDESGDYVVDAQDKVTAGFDAENARNLRISQETVDTLGDDGLADLAFMLGYREYYKSNGLAEEHINGYIEDWRAKFAETEQLMGDYQQFMGWATGEDTLKYMGRGLDTLRKILAAMERYRAIEKEWARRGLSKMQIIVMIEEMQETIRGIREQERGGGTGRGRGGSGRGRGGGGGGPRPGG